MLPDGLRAPCMPVQRPRRSYLVELAQFHSPAYLEFLQHIAPEAQEVWALLLCAFGEGPEISSGHTDSCTLRVGRVHASLTVW